MRLVISTLAVVFVTCLICGGVAWQIASNWIFSAAAAQAASQSSETIERIASIDQLSGAQVESAMRILEDLGQLKGVPSLKGVTDLNGKTVPDLHLGAESQVSNFAMVDHVKALAGGTATLFAWDGNNFTRVTTNVLKPDGSRAVGTVLDPKGKAFAALTQKQTFHGVVDILGAPYTTSYAPMLNGEGELVGAWYTGYRLDSIAALSRSIEKAVILDHGFVALLKPSGAVVVHGKQISDEALETLRHNPEGWKLQQETYPAWGYTVLTAYPNSDVFKRELTILSLPALGTVLMVGLIIGTQLLLMNRMVLRPVGQLTHQLAAADMNTLLDAGQHDEIGALAVSFNDYVLRLRKTLFHVRDGSAAATAKTNEIRTVANSAGTRMSQQLQLAEDASTAVAQLSGEIANTSSRTTEVSEHTREAADAAHHGNELVGSTVALIQKLSQDTQQSASRIHSLSERTNQIGTIVGVIEEIAAGTNLLALNASIEAARAGEHGRGFAVVAGEVRRLAERTAQATKQVSDLISGIEQETGKASSDILAACTHASQGAEAVTGLGNTFEKIAGLVIEVNGRMEQIARGTYEEESAANALREAMLKVASSAKDSAGETQMVISAASELLKTSKDLESMVEKFQLVDLAEDHAR